MDEFRQPDSPWDPTEVPVLNVQSGQDAIADPNRFDPICAAVGYGSPRGDRRPGTAVQIALSVGSDTPFGMTTTGTTTDGTGVTADQVLEIALSLPGVQRQASGEHTVFRVSGKGFGYLGPNGDRLQVKSTREEQAAWIGQDPETYGPSWASGRFGWIDVVLARTRHDEITELITEAWRLTAPARLARLLG